ncbi:MAG TPA: ATP-binding protein [Candidatus Binatia bacterium]
MRTPLTMPYPVRSQAPWQKLRGLRKLGHFRITEHFANASLTTRFALYSFVCVSIMTAALWLIVSNYLINQILDREWQTTAQMVRTDVRKFLEAYDFKTKDRKSVGYKFASLLDYMRLSPDIFGFKVYSPQSVVLWSDDKQLVGKAFPDNAQLQKALRGEVIADMASFRRSENSLDRNAPASAIEIYVPIYSESGKELLGVFETHRRADGVIRAIHQARLVVLLGALGGGLLLYFSLFAIVQRAARKIAEQQENLLKMRSELIASQRMAAIGEMAAAVAHGIGNPLSSIRATTQVAMLDAETDGCEKSPQMRANLQKIVQQVDRVQKRMQGLLNFVKPLEPRAVQIDINAVVRDVTETLRARFQDARVKLNLDLDAELPSIVSDANHLEQALMALITNALEATPENGAVTIRTQSRSNGVGPTVRMLIEDTGGGIPTENRERIFEPFFTTKPQGTGIGLPLAKKFLELNGGTIRIANDSGPGVAIEILLPVAGEEPKSLPDTTSGGAPDSVSLAES